MKMLKGGGESSSVNVHGVDRSHYRKDSEKTNQYVKSPDKTA